MKSMTGFGRATLEKNGRTYIIEMKSVNNKYSDVSIKLPRILSFAEEKIKKLIAKEISRGKIDVFVSFIDYSDKSKNVVINKNIANEYIKQLKDLAQENNLDTNIKIEKIAELPLVLIPVENEDTEEIEKEIIECSAQALDNLIKMRKIEGENIKVDLSQRISKIEKIVEQFSLETTGLIEEYVVKLEKRVSELLKTEIIDKNRIAQEAIIYSDKCSIEEELTRLNSHISQLKELFEETKPVGKKLDFIIQEMNRETNTIGSKSASKNITNLVIDMKVELEDIREQIQNIE